MILTDRDIAAAMDSGRLIVDGERDRIGPANYELRMGQVYYDLTEADRRIEVGKADTILIKPGHRVVLISIETLIIPPNMVARVASKGSLFSIGLTPVCTYADPGFEGNLGIVTQNISDKYIELPVGEPIAKVEFANLTGNVGRPYQGQHGFHEQIWPIKHHLQKSYDEVRKDHRVESEKIEAYKLLPAAAAELLQQMERRQKTVDIAIIAAVFVNAAILAVISTKVLDTTIGIAGNLIASAIVACIVLLTKRGK